MTNVRAYTSVSTRIMPNRILFYSISTHCSISKFRKTLHSVHRNCAMSDKKRDKKYKILLNSLALLIFVSKTLHKIFEKKNEIT